MKCDELKVETIVPQGSAITLQMYGKAEVDEAILELKYKLNNAIIVAEYVDKLENENVRLKESRQAWIARAGVAEENIAKLENLAKSSNSDFVSEYNELKIEIFKLQDRIKELKAQRDAFEKSFNEMTEAFMQSQRALWLARANSARNKVRFFGWAFDCYDIDTLINIDGHKYKMPRQNRLLACHHWIEIFENVEQLCKQKAKEYK